MDAAVEHDLSRPRQNTVENEAGTTTTWSNEDGELAHVTVSSENPAVIKFSIREDLIPTYEDDDMDALDEIGKMSLYADFVRKTHEGFVQGTMRCSHNASLGPPSFIQSVSGWVTE